MDITVYKGMTVGSLSDCVLLSDHEAAMQSLVAENELFRSALTEIRQTSVVHRYAVLSAIGMREVAVDALSPKDTK